MSAWRVIFTDSESASGVAPVCPSQSGPNGEHFHPNDPWSEYDVFGVYDCCPHPHIECWSPKAAEQVAQVLTEADAEVCS